MALTDSRVYYSGESSKFLSRKGRSFDRIITHESSSINIHADLEVITPNLNEYSVLLASYESQSRATEFDEEPLYSARINMSVDKV